MSIEELTNCPKCDAQWQGEDIYEYFLKRRADGDPYYMGKTDAEIRNAAGNYGWTEENHRCFGNLIGIELSYDHPQHYDGVSYWQCPDCKTTWNRFTNEEEEIPSK